MASTCRLVCRPCVRTVANRLLRRGCTLLSSVGNRKYSDTSGTTSDDVTVDDKSDPTSPTLTAFAKFVEESSKQTDSDSAVDKTEKDFAYLFRGSKFVQLGNPTKRVVLGTIVDVVNNDLYIDYGGKFYCVCPKPAVAETQGQTSQYKPGVQVKVILRDFEMTSAFLGSEKHVTLLESDALLIGLFKASEKNLEKRGGSQVADNTSDIGTSEAKKHTEEVQQNLS